MIKKILAAMTAVVMCAGMAACGNTAEEGSGKSEGTSAAAAESKADDAKEDNLTENGEDKDTETTSGESGDKDGNEQAGPSAQDGTGDYDDEINTGDATYRLMGNIIYMAEPDIEAEPTADELKKAVETALVQYRAAEAEDMKAFIDSFNFESIKKPLLQICKDTYSMSEEEFMQLLNNGMSTQYEVVSDVADLIQDIGDEETVNKLFEAADNNEPDKMEEHLKTLIDGITPDADSVKEKIGSLTMYTSEEAVEPLEDINDDTIYGIYVEYCGRDGDDLYISATVSVVTENYEYGLNDLDVWRVDGEWGAYIRSASRYDKEEELKGADAKTLYEMLTGNQQTIVEDYDSEDIKSEE